MNVTWEALIVIFKIGIFQLWNFPLARRGGKLWKFQKIKLVWGWYGLTCRKSFFGNVDFTGLQVKKTTDFGRFCAPCSCHGPHWWAFTSISRRWAKIWIFHKINPQILGQNLYLILWWSMNINWGALIVIFKIGIYFRLLSSKMSEDMKISKNKTCFRMGELDM